LLSILLSELRPKKVLAVQVPVQGRVVYNSLVVRAAPAFSGDRVHSVPRDTILNIIGEVFGGLDGDYNRIWYRIGNGEYVYSGGVQPVHTFMNSIATGIPETGILGEITIPFADTVWTIPPNFHPGPRLYFGSTHWIKKIVQDQSDGSRWYKIYDTLYNTHYYIRTEGMHIFSPEELSPLSPQVPGIEKHIEIILDRQILLAFEWDVLVFAARVATGQENFETPTGRFWTFHKRPTYHMSGGVDVSTVFDLPGVPWDSYITDTGVAIHGTYWHNDFGHPHSHGCINLAIQDAKWIYRWTQPTVPAGEHLILEPGVGTRVLIAQS
jgi:lipoprotein-anchoring transpeptidase ErfK/SrfK